MDSLSQSTLLYQQLQQLQLQQINSAAAAAAQAVAVDSGTARSPCSSPTPSVFHHHHHLQHQQPPQVSPVTFVGGSSASSGVSTSLSASPTPCAEYLTQGSSNASINSSMLPPAPIAGGISLGLPHGSISPRINAQQQQQKHHPYQLSPSSVSAFCSSLPSSLSNIPSSSSPLTGAFPPVSGLHSPSTAGGSILSGTPVIAPRVTSPQNLEPDSVPAQSFTQLMQSYQSSGSDTPPENFSKLLQSLQSPNRAFGGVGAGLVGGSGVGSGGSGGMMGFQRLSSNSPPHLAGGGGGGSGGGGSGGGSVQGLMLGSHSSPPDSFQNLHMIQEDTKSYMLMGEELWEEDEEMKDVEDKEEEEDRRLGRRPGNPGPWRDNEDLYNSDTAVASPPSPSSYHRALTPTSSSELDQYLQEPLSPPMGHRDGSARRHHGKKRHFAGTPQISITDTQGHVTDVITTDHSDLMEARTEALRSSISGHGFDVGVCGTASQNQSHHLQQQQLQQDNSSSATNQPLGSLMECKSGTSSSVCVNVSSLQQQQLHSSQSPSPTVPKVIISSSSSPCATPSSSSSSPSSSVAAISLSSPSTPSSSLPSTGFRPSPYRSLQSPTSPSSSPTPASTSSSLRNQSASSRLRRHRHHHHHHMGYQHYHHHHHHYYHQSQHHKSSSDIGPYPSAYQYPDPMGSLGYYGPTHYHQRQPSPNPHAIAIPLLSQRSMSPTCLPQGQTLMNEDGDNTGSPVPTVEYEPLLHSVPAHNPTQDRANEADSPLSIPPSISSSSSFRGRSMDDTVLASRSHFSPLSSHITFTFASLATQPTTPLMPRSSPSSCVCSPSTSPIPIITTSAPPSPSGQTTEVVPSSSPSPSRSVSPSPSPSPSPPSTTSIQTSSCLSSSRPSSPLFPSVGPSPSSSSPTQGCYSPATSPFPTPANTPRPSISITDSGHSEMEQDSSPVWTPVLDDSTCILPVLLEIKTGHRKSVGDVLQAVKAALNSVCQQVDYECQERSFRLNGHSNDLQMELEVCCSETDGHVPGLQVRKLSGDNLEYAKLCNHLMACVNN